jgi:hypothetical protein
MTDHDALASSLALRLGSCSMRELRAIDLVMRALEAKRAPASLPEPDEAHEWDRDAHMTREVKLSDIDDREPYEDFDLSDVDEPLGVQMPGFDRGEGG